jgi:hypothetical protein
LWRRRPAKRIIEEESSAADRSMACSGWVGGGQLCLGAEKREEDACENEPG